MDYSIDRWINQLMHAHPLMAQAVIQFSSWGVALFGVLAVCLWLLSPPGDTTWKRACAAGLGAATLGLGINQVLTHIWSRPRPYVSHHALVPLISPSADPSFPSDHATAAFSIALGIFFVSRRAGWLFLPFAMLIGASRVLAGMHYPSDIAASFAVSLVAGYVAARVAMEPVLVPLIRVVSRITDPLLSALTRLNPVRRTICNPRFRVGAIAIIGLLVFGRIAYAERSHLLDELEMIVLAAWLSVTYLAIRLASVRYWPAARRAARAAA